VNFGDMPVMVKSQICPLSTMSRDELIAIGEDPDDPGGYFIINGTERILVLVEEIAQNRIIVEKVDSGNVTEVARIHSEKDGYIQRHLLERKTNGIITISFANIEKLPVAILIKALGLESDKEIVNFISSDEEVQGEFYTNLYEVEITSKQEALDEIGKHIKIAQKESRVERATKLIDKYFLPHLGQTPETRIDKALFLCKAVGKLIKLHLGKIEEDDLDHYSNKRIRLSGDLLEILLRSILLGKWGLITRITYNYQKLAKRGRIPPLQAIVESNVLTNQIISALAIGSWVGGRTGVSQRLERGSFIKTISHMRNVLSPLTSTQEHFGARELHPTHFGKLCLGKDTNILLCRQYSTKTLEELEKETNKMSVLTYEMNSGKFVKSKIINYFKSNPKIMNRKVYSILSEGNRQIIATQDHPFLTKTGWVEVEKLNVGDLVAVYPTIDIIPKPLKISSEKLIDEQDIKNLFPKRYKHYIKKLERIGLLPLTMNNEKLEIIARLMGAIFSDGSCGNTINFYCGSIEDVEAIRNDIEDLGIKPGKWNESSTKIKINGKLIRYKTFRTSKGGELRALLIALGVPVGNKKNVPYRIPEWLFRAPLNVKREFLAGYMGGDGAKPLISVNKRCKQSSRIVLPETIFYKMESLTDNGIEFAKDLEKLFSDFGVKLRIKTGGSYTRKDGTKVKKIIIKFNNSVKNIANFTQKIGFRYCISKERISNLIGEYLRIKQRHIEERNKLRAKIMKLRADGYSNSQIADKLNLSKKFVETTIERFYKFKRANPRILPPHIWLKKYTEVEKGIVWEKIVSKELIDCSDVRDITTESNSHNFIANNFIVHNCTSETPEGATIGLRKYLAIMAEITKGLSENERKSFYSSIQKMVV
jgi:intein/homing endonuclease